MGNKDKYVRLKNHNTKAYEFKKAIILLGSDCEHLSKKLGFEIECSGSSFYKRGILLIQHRANANYQDVKVSLKEIKALVGRRRYIPFLKNRIPYNAMEILNSFIYLLKIESKLCDLNDSNIKLESNCLDSFLSEIQRKLTSVKLNNKDNEESCEKVDKLKVNLTNIKELKCCPN